MKGYSEGQRDGGSEGYSGHRDGGSEGYSEGV